MSSRKGVREAWEHAEQSSTCTWGRDSKSGRWQTWHEQRHQNESGWACSGGSAAGGAWAETAGSAWHAWGSEGHGSGADRHSWSWWPGESVDDAAPGPDSDWIKEPAASHETTLIFFHSCHGRPEHAAGFLDDLREFSAVDERHLRIVAPAAPRRFTEMDQAGTLQWFEYRTEQLLEGADQDDADTAQLAEQRQRLLLLLRDELQKLPSHGRLVMGGLSQGASIVADVLMHLEGPADKRLCGAFFKRGFVQRESVEDLPPKPVSALLELPALATHGIEDDWVPFMPAQKSYDLLQQRGGQLTFREIRGLRHNGYSRPEARILADFVGKVLRPARQRS